MRKSFRVLVTDKCNMRCPTCFNRELRGTKEMSVEDFTAVCKHLRDEGGIVGLKIMGGEPTTHPRFNEILAVAQEHFRSVHVFTNALNEVIAGANLRKDDTVIYNVWCMSENFPAEKLLPKLDCNRAFETRIDASANVPRIKRVLRHVHSILGTGMFVNLTLNCTENIFERKDQVIANWNEIVALVEDELKIDYRIDHGIPYCFFMGSKMRVRMRAVHCSMDCAGLIGPDLSLRHCNQTSENLTCIRQGGRFVPYKILDQYLLCEHSRMQHDCLAKLCRDCVLYGEKCNGGCFMFKPLITRESIVDATDLPLQ